MEAQGQDDSLSQMSLFTPEPSETVIILTDLDGKSQVHDIQLYTFLISINIASQESISLTGGEISEEDGVMMESKYNILDW